METITIQNVQFAIRCPNNSMVYNRHFVEVREEDILGENFHSDVAKDMCDDPNNPTKDEMGYIALTTGFALLDSIEELTLPDGVLSRGWKAHPHKDALGLVALYFDFEDPCPQCGGSGQR